MKKLMSKKANIFGKKVPVFVIALIAFMGLGSAALLAYFGVITGSVIVSQGFKVDGQDWNYAFSYSDTLTSLETKNVSSAEYSLVNSAPVDADVKFTTVCSGGDGCSDVTTTDMVLLSVMGFGGSDDPFDRPYYKKTYYNPLVTTLSALSDVAYSFKIINNGFGVTNLAPYVVIVGEGIGSSGVAVQMIPDGGTYNAGVEYTKNVGSTTLFHVPGDTECTQSAPCTLAKVKEKWPSATISKIVLALGAWPGTHSQVITASMGISKINDLQAVHKSLIVGAGETSSLKVVTYFPKMMKPATYTITTTVEPVSP